MNTIHFKKPDIKGKIEKLRHLSREDLKESAKKRKERRQRILEERKNSAFAKKMAPVYKWMNLFSLPLQAIWAMAINLIIESISRHSFVSAWSYAVETPLVFLYNSFMIFVTFSIVDRKSVV